MNLVLSINDHADDASTLCKIYDLLAQTVMKNHPTIQ